MTKVETALQEQIKTLAVMERELNDKVATIKAAQDEIDATWERVKAQMQKHDIKQVKGDFGSITLTKRIGWKVDMEKLPRKFTKRVADNARITSEFKLSGKSPEGAEATYTEFITKRLKG